MVKSESLTSQIAIEVVKHATFSVL